MSGQDAGSGSSREPDGSSDRSSGSAPRRLHPEVFIARRRARLEQLLQHPLVPPRDSGAPPERRRFLLEEAEALYWNELDWEKRTAEEMSKGGSELVEMAFPGFLAFIDGLLLREVHADSPAPASPRPEVVEDVLMFLATRCLELMPETGREGALEREMTERLVDLVLYRLHRLAVDDASRIAPSRHGQDP